LFPKQSSCSLNNYSPHKKGDDPRQTAEDLAPKKSEEPRQDGAGHKTFQRMSEDNVTILTLEQLCARLREEIQRRGGVRKMARDFDVSSAAMSRLVNSSRRPGRKLLEQFGFKAITVYRDVDAASNGDGGRRMRDTGGDGWRTR